MGDGLAREIRASLTVESEDFWGSTWYLSLFGIHFPDTGSIVLTTSSEKFGGIFSLPHFICPPIIQLVPSPSSQVALGRYLGKAESASDAIPLVFFGGNRANRVPRAEM